MMAGIIDERLASATGSRINKVFRQAQAFGKANDIETAPDSWMELVEQHQAQEVPLRKDEATTKRFSISVKSSCMSVSTLAYIIVLLVVVFSVFGLEVYRIREAGHINQRLTLLQEELNVFRQESILAFNLRNPGRSAEAPFYGGPKDGIQVIQAPTEASYNHVEINK